MLVVKNPAYERVDQTMIYAEDTSRLNFLEELYTGAAEHDYLVSSLLEVRAGSSSHVDASSLQLLDEKATYLTNKRVDASSDSRVNITSILLGGRPISRSRMDMVTSTAGARQSRDLRSSSATGSSGSTSSRTSSTTPRTPPPLFTRGACSRIESQSIFKGMIKINHIAKNASSYLAHHAMLLDKGARSDGIPGLDIETNEVKATHSASVAQVDEDQVFYLRARGLPEDEAKKMIVLGFFEPVVSRIPVEMAREGAKFIIEGKWYGERRRLIDTEALMAITGEGPVEVRQSGDVFERHYKYRA